MNTVTDKNVAFLFVDIETTGLDPSSDRILEVGLATVNELFQVIDEKNWLIAERGWRAKLSTNEFVWDMHQNSGLIVALDRAWAEVGQTATTRYSLESVQNRICNWIESRVGRIPMSGSSVHFDRSFLAYDMPRVVERFSHRNIDVSSVKELAHTWYPEIAAKWNSVVPKAEAKHRALDDIHDSIAELKYYREAIFIP